MGLDTLSDNNQFSTLADMTSDFILLKAEEQKVKSTEDLAKLSDQICSDWTVNFVAKDKQRFKDGVRTFVLAFTTARDAGGWVNLPQRAEVGESSKRYLMVSSTKGMVVRLPNFNEDDKLQKELVSKILTWVSCMIDSSAKIKIIKDADLGDKLWLSKKLDDSMVMLLSNLTMVDSNLPSHKFPQGVQANLPETLALLKAIRENGPRVRRLDSKKTPLNGMTIRENVYIRMGLKEKNIPSYLTEIVKAVINQASRPQAPKFPGIWTKSLKDSNKKTTKAGILALAGYTPKALNYSKVTYILKERAVTETVSTTDSSSPSECG